MYFLLIVIMPLLCSWFLMDLIKTGSVQRVPVGIVDLTTVRCRVAFRAT